MEFFSEASMMPSYPTHTSPVFTSAKARLMGILTYIPKVDISFILSRNIDVLYCNTISHITLFHSEVYFYRYCADSDRPLQKVTEYSVCQRVYCYPWPVGLSSCFALKLKKQNPWTPSNPLLTPGPPSPPPCGSCRSVILQGGQGKDRGGGGGRGS